MTDFTPPPALTINPLWVTLGTSLVRMVLLTGGAATAATAQSQAEQIVAGIVTVATGAWALYSWYASHEKAKALNAAPANAAVVK